MDIVSLLTGPDGVLLSHAVILLLISVIGYWTAIVRQRTKALQKQLDGHMQRLQEHVLSTEAEGQSPQPEAPA